MFQHFKARLQLFFLERAQRRRLMKIKERLQKAECTFEYARGKEVGQTPNCTPIYEDLWCAHCGDRLINVRRHATPAFFPFPDDQAVFGDYCMACGTPDWAGNPHGTLFELLSSLEQQRDPSSVTAAELESAETLLAIQKEVVLREQAKLMKREEDVRRLKGKPLLNENEDYRKPPAALPAKSK